jgi:hypothetical protein
MSDTPTAAPAPDVRPAVVAVVTAIELWMRWATGQWPIAPLVVGGMLLALFTFAPGPMRPVSTWG